MGRTVPVALSVNNGGAAPGCDERGSVNVKRKYQALVVLGLGGLVMASTTAAGAATTKAPSAGDRKPVIVVLRNQHQELPARGAGAQRRMVTQSEQAPLVDQARAGGATNVKRFSVVNGLVYVPETRTPF